MSEHAKCLTCGSPVRVSSSDEGTHCYIPALDIYGTMEAQALLGVKASWFHDLSKQPGFPAPAEIWWPGWTVPGRLAATQIWNGPELREYAAKRKSQ